MTQKQKLGGYEYKKHEEGENYDEFEFTGELGPIMHRKFMDHHFSSIHSTLRDAPHGVPFDKETYQVINCAVKVSWDSNETIVSIFNDKKSQREKTIKKLDEIFG